MIWERLPDVIHKTDPEDPVGSAIHSADFQPNGGRLATGGANKVHIWWLDMHGKVRQPHRGPAIDLTDESGDGGGRVEDRDYLPRCGCIRLATLSHGNSSVSTVRWSPSGNQLASCDWPPPLADDPLIGPQLQPSREPAIESGAVLIWQRFNNGGQSASASASAASSKEQNLEDWRRVHILKPSPGTQTREVSDISWCPDGLHLASSGTDGKVLIWHVQTQTLRSTLSLGANAGAEWANGIAWDPLDQFMVVALEQKGRLIAVWERSDRVERHRHQVCGGGHEGSSDGGEREEGQVSAADGIESSDGQWRLTATIREPFEDGPRQPSFYRHPSWDPEGRNVVLPYGESPNSHATFGVLFERGRWADEPWRFLGHPHRVCAVRFLPVALMPLAGKQPFCLCAMGSHDGALSIWKCGGHQVVCYAIVKDFLQPDASLIDLAWTNDGLALVITCSDGSAGLFRFDANDMGGRPQNEGGAALARPPSCTGLAAQASRLRPLHPLKGTAPAAPQQAQHKREEEPSKAAAAATDDREPPPRPSPAAPAASPAPAPARPAAAMAAGGAMGMPSAEEVLDHQRRHTSEQQGRKRIAPLILQASSPAAAHPQPQAAAAAAAAPRSGSPPPLSPPPPGTPSPSASLPAVDRQEPLNLLPEGAERKKRKRKKDALPGDNSDEDGRRGDEGNNVRPPAGKKAKKAAAPPQDKKPQQQQQQQQRQQKRAPEAAAGGRGGRSGNVTAAASRRPHRAPRLSMASIQATVRHLDPFYEAHRDDMGKILAALTEQGLSYDRIDGLVDTMDVPYAELVVRNDTEGAGGSRLIYELHEPGCQGGDTSDLNRVVNGVSSRHLATTATTTTTTTQWDYCFPQDVISHLAISSSLIAIATAPPPPTPPVNPSCRLPATQPTRLKGWQPNRAEVHLVRRQTGSLCLGGLQVGGGGVVAIALDARRLGVLSGDGRLQLWCLDKPHAGVMGVCLLRPLMETNVMPFCLDNMIGVHSEGSTEAKVDSVAQMFLLHHDGIDGLALCFRSGRVLAHQPAMKAWLRVDALPYPQSQHYGNVPGGGGFEEAPRPADMAIPPLSPCPLAALQHYHPSHRHKHKAANSGAPSNGPPPAAAAAAAAAPAACASMSSGRNGHGGPLTRVGALVGVVTAQHLHHQYCCSCLVGSNREVAFWLAALVGHLLDHGRVGQLADVLEGLLGWMAGDHTQTEGADVMNDGRFVGGMSACNGGQDVSMRAGDSGAATSDRGPGVGVVPVASAIMSPLFQRPPTQRAALMGLIKAALLPRLEAAPSTRPTTPLASQPVAGLVGDVKTRLAAVQCIEMNE
ncbi:unnamed protein product [Vitrella brassicaformis CCMP3155]|uniref:Uncharacterized protein n=1 Tax=Vitrella brassicaformis (strain CCMP3155) TaxID=1169540 RepID=A0A0G4H5S0_VITBC|nr:unnamed protein product [Vitrella brassicaformis CCMP3155]|eukprot:CEM39165.1 unnamed protein product [Vitrella brassicaformis CCMP3155]